MWCARCQADVAAEVLQDSRSVRCTTCGTEIGDSISTRTESRTRQARALLERWSQERDTNPFDAGPRATVVDNEERREADHPDAPASVAKPPFADPPRSKPQPTTPPSPKSLRIDAAHAPPEAGDEPSVRSVNRQTTASAAPIPQQVADRNANSERGPKKITNWASTAGQWLAYSGILGLMTGTCLVILGYFRGPESYAPTGWLITTAGQMLLFLGVVTLVSSGIEESSNTVTDQIGRLDERLIRIEQATDTLRGPHSLSQFERRNDETTADANHRINAT